MFVLSLMTPKAFMWPLSRYTRYSRKVNLQRKCLLIYHALTTCAEIVFTRVINKYDSLAPNVISNYESGRSKTCRKCVFLELFIIPQLFRSVKIFKTVFAKTFNKNVKQFRLLQSSGLSSHCHLFNIFLQTFRSQLWCLSSVIMFLVSSSAAH